MGMASGLACVALNGILRQKYRGVSHVMLGLSSAFAGGVFLGAGFLHLLPESEESYPVESIYPLAYLTTAMAILLMIFLEKVAIPLSMIYLVSMGRCLRVERFFFVPPRPLKGPEGSPGVDRRRPESSTSSSGSPQASDPEGTDVVVVDVEAAKPPSGENTALNSGVTVGPDGPKAPAPQGRSMKDYDTALMVLVLAGALCGHSLFEGLPIGLSKSLDFALVPFIAVILHKGFAIWALAAELVLSPLRLWLSLLLSFAVSVLSPLGVVLGSAVASDHALDIHEQLSSVFDAIAAGTFIYIGLMELNHHMIVRATKLSVLMLSVQWAMAAVGFTVMALLAIFV